MRISVDETDAGFGVLWARWATISLDGKRMRDVVTADEEAGTVTLYLREEGSLVHDGDNFTLQTLHGAVVVGIRDDAPATMKALAPERVGL
ncbi:hypothetical protein [Ancylobacter sp. IITR112]|uniref:hypothetical protein n=1 Tax=Ancylobacter sp. IITR112 TaxID=3138073 RepID=UPI00352AA434